LQFSLLDKVISLSEVQIVAIKQVSLAEEYLADHFPTFPVLPGVLMLEAATQASGWLLHHRSNFAKSMAVLREARNIKYGNFVAPGSLLRITAELKKETASGGGSFNVTGEVLSPGAGGVTTSSNAFGGKVEIAYFSLSDKGAADPAVDAELIAHHRRRWDLIKPATGPELSTNTVVAL
jgi:3-hydroxyacyl-[acyl-carrier-protein] dehydratase